MPLQIAPHTLLLTTVEYFSGYQLGYLIVTTISERIEEQLSCFRRNSKEFLGEKDSQIEIS
jgi:hypothetical protein